MFPEGSGSGDRESSPRDPDTHNRSLARCLALHCLRCFVLSNDSPTRHWTYRPVLQREG